MARARRGRGEGGVYQRADGVWCASVSVGYDPDGKRKRRVLYGETKREVQDKLREVQEQVSRGIMLKPSKLRVSEFLKTWLKNSVHGSVRPNTYASYESTVNTHLIPRL